MDHTRHIGIFDASALSATIIGCGGIGSPTALLLAKMGVRHLSLFDFDTVDEINLATQMHRLSDVGRPKVDALADLIEEFSDTTVETHCRAVTADDAISDYIVISAVDSIAARQQIWRAVRGRCMYYIDTRMGAEFLRIHTVGDDDKSYDDMMLTASDANTIDEPCTARATMYTGFGAAERVGYIVRQIATGIEPPSILTYDFASYTTLAIP